MKTIKCAFFMLAFAGVATAQQPRPMAVDVRDLSRQWVKYYAERRQLPPELVEAVIDEESAWNPYAVSKKGAVGLMQLMPKTAVRFGVRNRFHIEQNIQGGTAYLSLLNQQFNGDFRLVLAAYYAGESLIRLRGLGYANPDVYRYVCRVAKRYQARRARTAGFVSAQQGWNEVSDEQYP